MPLRRFIHISFKSFGFLSYEHINDSPNFFFDLIIIDKFF